MHIVTAVTASIFVFALTGGSFSKLPLDLRQKTIQQPSTINQALTSIAQYPAKPIVKNTTASATDVLNLNGKIKVKPEQAQILLEITQNVKLRIGGKEVINCSDTRHIRNRR